MQASVTIHNSGGPGELTVTRGREVLRRQKVRSGAEVAVNLGRNETIRFRDFREDEQYQFADDSGELNAEGVAGAPLKVWQGQPLSYWAAAN